MAEKRIRPAAPFYFAAAVWILCGILLPMYTLWGICAALLLSAAAYLIGMRLIPPRVITIQEPPEPIDTGDEELNRILSEGSERLEELKSLQTWLTGTVRDCTDRMIRAGDAIFKEIRENPEKAPSVRRFADYYLPEVVQILKTYIRMKQTKSGGENVSELAAKVESNAEMMARAFEKQLDGLYLNEMLDITTDITVLENMMKGDGLTNGDNQ